MTTLETIPSYNVDYVLENDYAFVDSDAFGFTLGESNYLIEITGFGTLTAYSCDASVALDRESIIAAGHAGGDHAIEVNCTVN